jgi:hypothetical protein
MARESKFGKTDPSMKEIGFKIWHGDMVNSYIKMEIFMKVSG